MKELAMPDYRKTKGFVRLIFLRRIEKRWGHFTLITFWENLEVIRNFAGQEYERANYLNP